MTVYVDDMRLRARVGRLDARWSHLTADTKRELHAFARRLGLLRSWFQDKPHGLWHYDVTDGKRQLAIRLGAEQISYGNMEDFERVWHKPGREGREPVLVDLCCKAGGSSVGFARAGFQVIGIDKDDQPDYPFEFYQIDILELDPARLAARAAVVVASPPCWANSTLRHGNPHKRYVDIIAETRALLVASGRPFVIENVVGAPLRDPITLCGSMFGLGADCSDGKWRQLRRHRNFEAGGGLELSAPGPCQHKGEPVGVYGGGPSRGARGYKGLEHERKQAMGIDWMKRKDLPQAIPPAFTEHLGRQILAQI